MSALAIIVCAFAFMTVSDIQSFSISSLIPSIPVVGSIKDGVGSIVENAVDDGIKALKNDLEKAKNISSYIANDLNKTAVGLVDKFTSTVKSEIKKVSDAVDEILSNAQGENVTNCKKIAATKIVYSYAVITNVTSCVTDKIEEGASYARNVTSNVYSALKELLQIKEKIEKCKEGSGLIHSITSPLCGSIITGETAISVVSKVPIVGINVAKLANLVASIQYTLPTCVAENAVYSIIEELRAVTTVVIRCIGEKLLE